MGKIRFFKNLLENEYDEIEVPEGTLVKDIIKEYSSENPYKEDYVECYDPETKETWLEPLDKDSEASVLVLLNEDVVDPDYSIKDKDFLYVFYLPTDPAVGQVLLAGFRGALSGASFGSIFGGYGAIIGGVLGFFAGLGVGIYQSTHNNSDGDIKKIKKTEEELKKQPDIRGSNNQSLTNNVYPFLFGKHLITPLKVGKAVTTYEGELGQDAYISLLLCAGYAPLKLTDFKLGEYFLAYNRTKGVEHNTVLSGLLKGYSTGGEADNGDILDIWASNDINLEIIQQIPGEPLNRGEIYPTTKIDKLIDAHCLYIVDKPLTELANIVYKGASFPNNFKSNNVYFTQSFPKSFDLTLNAPAGLFASYSKNTEEVSEIVYESLPLWYCVQWRPFNSKNLSSKSDGTDFDEWKPITIFNNNNNTEAVYTEEERKADIAAHKGNTIEDPLINEGFINKKVCNFSCYSGKDYVSEMRFTAHVEIPAEIIEDIVFNKDNPIHGIEVRILRISPSYQNQRQASGDNGPVSYSDTINIKSICTEILDAELYKKTGEIKALNAIPYDSDLKKFCYIALKAKADLNGYINQSFERVSCTAESFSPTWDMTNKKWLPTDISKIIKYYGYYDPSKIDLKRIGNISYRKTVKKHRVKRSSLAFEVEVTEAEYNEARKEQYNWIQARRGSNYTDRIKEEIFTTKDSKGRYILDKNGAKFNDNCSASGFMLGIVGPQNGIIAKGYEDINLSSVGNWYEDCQEVTDGSLDENEEEVKIRMEANGYLYKSIKLETFLGKVATTGRAVFTVDNDGKIKIVMDKPVSYPVGVISDQNCISAQDTYSYKELPAGLVMSFSDENDGYRTNQIYCWSDGNSFENYKGQVQSYNIDYVTNPVQTWSLGRYALANILLNKEGMVRKIGVEGMLYTIGDVLMVQSDTLLIGEGSGRIQKILQNDSEIFGFISDSTMNYTGETDENGNIKQGVSILRPRNVTKDKVLTYRLASEGTSVDVDGINYTQTKGVTNVILFETPLDRYIYSGGELISSKDNIKIGNICLFGEVDRIAAPYKIIKIKQEADNTFTETLVRYNEDIYNYGARLPVFQTYTRADPVSRDPVSLSEVPSNILGLNDSNHGNNTYIENQMSKFYANHVVNLYKKSKSLLTETGIKSALIYDFSTDTLEWADPLNSNGWQTSYTEAEKGNGTMYFTSATALGRKVKSVIYPSKWQTPIAFGANGLPGGNGFNGITVFPEKSSIITPSDLGGVVEERTIVNKIHFKMGNTPVPFTFGKIEPIPGFDFNYTRDSIIIKILPGAEMADNGFIAIPINSHVITDVQYISDEHGNRYMDEDGSYYSEVEFSNERTEFTIYVSYAKAKEGKRGSAINKVEEFYLTTNRTDITDKDYKDFSKEIIPTTPQNPYLWNYEQTNFTDGREPLTTMPAMIGNYSKDGASLVGIKEMYLISNRSSGITSEDPNWKETPPPTTPQEPYLWNYEILEKDDGKKIETIPVVIGVHGIKGKSVNKVIEYYLVSEFNSGIDYNNKEWKPNTPPVTTKEKPYLWNYEETYLEGETSYNNRTEPTLIGTRGEDGKGIVKIEEFYLTTDKKEGVKKAEVTSKTFTPTTPQKPYLWNKEKIYYTIGTPIETDPVIIGTHGSIGPEGPMGAQGPSYLGMYSSSHELPLYSVVGSWYLNSSDGYVYVKTERTSNPWDRLPMDYNDHRIKEAVNDMMQLAVDKPQLDEVFSRVTTAWINNLVVNKAFVKNLFAQQMKITDNGNIIGGDRFEENRINYNKTGFKITADGKIRGTFVGDDDLRNNVFLGPNVALSANTTKDCQLNTFVGSDIAPNMGEGNANVVIGNQAGKALKDASSNVFIGTEAGVDTDRYGNIGKGGGNTFIGTRAGANNKNGRDNTAVGYFADFKDPEGVNQINIGNVYQYGNGKPYIKGLFRVEGNILYIDEGDPVSRW